MRVYSEKEIQNLLRQAAALQAARRDPSNGLTLDEIRRIAQEAGIDASFVDQAANGLTAKTSSNRADGFWGGTYRVASEMTLNHTVDEDEWAIMVAEIRRSMGQRGQSEALGRGFDWRYTVNGQEYSHVTLTPRGERTHVDVSRANQAGLWYVAPGVLGFFAILMGFISTFGAADAPSILTPIVLALLTVATFPIARALFASATRKLERKNADMLERLALISTRLGRTPRARTAANEAAARYRTARRRSAGRGTCRRADAPPSVTLSARQVCADEVRKLRFGKRSGGEVLVDLNGAIDVRLEYETAAPCKH